MNKEYRKRMNAAINFINKNYSHDLSLDDIAQEAHFSKYHFHRIFKAFTEETVSNYIRRIRLENGANKLLIDSGKTITDIAFECGFNSSQNFATAFKKKFNLSPKEYRTTNTIEDWGLKTEKENRISKFDKRINNTSDNNFWINLIMMPSYHVVYERILGQYNFNASNYAFEKLLSRTNTYFDTSSSMLLGIVWDNPEITNPENCRYDACLTIPSSVKFDGNVETQITAEGEYVVGHCEVSSYTDLEFIYDQIYSTWFSDNDYFPADSAPYEIYLNNPINHPRGNFLIEICIPVYPI
jgi:AraC family transcriptional regulator